MTSRDFIFDLAVPFNVDGLRWGKLVGNRRPSGAYHALVSESHPGAGAAEPLCGPGKKSLFRVSLLKPSIRRCKECERLLDTRRMLEVMWH